jgi:pectate lyase
MKKIFKRTAVRCKSLIIPAKIFLFMLVLVMMTLVSCQPGTGPNIPEWPSMDPAVVADQINIIKTLAGDTVVTNGWGDMGSGMAYTDPATVLVIDDETYPDPIAKRKAFTNAVSSNTEKFIILNGAIDLSDGKISDKDHSYYDEFNSSTGARLHGDIVYNIGSNTTIFGVNSARIMFGGMKISSKSNIIIRNIIFYDAHGSTEVDTKKDSGSKASIDALGIEGSSSNIWVDHCTFTDGVCSDMIRNYNHDGAFDIKQGVNITVSYCEFTNHDKVMLIAGSDSESNAVSTDRQITLHHNYFHATTQRMPRTRGCEMHIYNNYYDDIGVSGNGGYSLGPGVGAQFIVENNYFGSHMSGIVDYFTKAPYPNPKLYQSGNNKDISSGGGSYVVSTKPWVIPYTYSPESASGLNSSIPKNAGSGKLANNDGSLE